MNVPVRRSAASAAFLAALAIQGPAAIAAGPPDPAALEFFEAKVRPLLVSECYACHSADTKPAGGLRVDDLQGLLVGGDNGPAVVPHDPEASLLLKRVKSDNEKRRMPREAEALDGEQVAILTRWIQDGAAWPPIKAPASLTQPKDWYEPLKKEHWAWQPLKSPEVPTVADGLWPASDLDRFVLSRLEAEGLRPVGDAGPATLLRRVTFDLTGLPPTPADLDAFRADPSPDAFARVVDRLLASNQFGERWGRHWLDVGRYGESSGPSRNMPYPHAWRYRDYVIDAVNADVPFDRFVAEQIAGDLLPANSPAERNRLLTATGFLALGVKDVNQRFKTRFQMDNVDDQIDAVSRSVLAMTVTCARCHDHKFDPIPTADYYALAGIFTSTENAAGLRSKMGGSGLDYYDPSLLVRLEGGPPPPPESEVKELKAKVDEAKKAWDAIRGTREGLAKGPDGFPNQRKFRLELERLSTELLEVTDPAARGFAVHGARDAKAPADTAIRLRGEAEKLGPTVPRGFLTAFEVPGAPEVNPEQSGRLELARWLASPQNPVTPRVIVNRVWRHLFGRGIVSTVDNFGTTGDAPSHPELLDHLAGQFVRDGWSIKRLVRSVVLSRSYRLAPDATEENLAADPANALVWRHAPRRLDAEEVRDAVLATAGKLTPGRPEGSPARDLKMIEMRDNGPEAALIHEKADASTHRSVYLPLLRGVVPKALAAFDPVEQTLVTGQRENTTVPSQALFLLNSAFVREQSLATARRLLNEEETDEARILALYRLALGREARSVEVERARTFLKEYAAAQAEIIAASPPENEPEPEAAPPARKAKAPAPRPALVNADEVDQTDDTIVESVVRVGDARTAAWLAFAQSIFGSAEFRYVR